MTRSLLATLLLVLGAACDETFRPTEAGEAHFSVFGYLDASADTQWIRVMPIRSLVTEPVGALHARVTLEHLGAGRVIELTDSVFQFDHVDPELESEGLFLHNFWTTERIEPGAAYRFVVRAEDGRSSEAVIRIPPKFEVEVWRRQVPSQIDLFHVVGLKHVALVGTSSYFTDTCGPAVDHLSYTHTALDSAFHRIPPFEPVQFRVGCGAPRTTRRAVWLAGSGVEWPRGLEHANPRLAVPDALSNVAGSVGFLGGVLIRRVPFEACQLVVPFGPPREHCVLRYDESTAVLSGTVEDARCGGWVHGATVQLREIVQQPAPFKIRPTGTDELGQYEIAALEPGRRYALSISQVTPEGELFQEYRDTLEFAPGERRVHDANLIRIERCPEQS